MSANLWEAKTDPIVQRFMQTQRYQQIIQNDKIVCIFVGGSQGYNRYYLTENSDYDVIILLDNDSKLPESTFLTVLGRELQYSYRTVENMLGNMDKILFPYAVEASYSGQLKFNWFRPEQFLFINPKYQSIVDKLLLYRNQIQLLNFHKYVQLVAQNPAQQYHTCPKAFYHIFAAYLELTGVGSKEWIREIKSNPPAENTKILGFFQTILDWCAAHPIDLIAMERNLYECFYDENNKLIL